MHVPVNSEPRAKALPRLRLGYERTSARDLLDDVGVLAVIGFGDGVGLDDPRCIRVGLDTLHEPLVEVWRVAGKVSHGIDGAIRWSSDGDYLFFAIDVHEADAGGLDAAAERAYREITALIDHHRLIGDARPEVLRLWNYLDAINDGAGDEERYRHFCSGRARGLGERARNGFSAATAIGRRDGRRVLQVYGLAARAGGVAIENPRQVSAWRYPREYGPTAPTFARASLTGAGQLLVSGTAAVVGHASQHAGDTLAQLDETLVNLDQLLLASGELGARQDARRTLLKVYVRDGAEAAAIEQRIRERHPDIGGVLLLAGDICRRELRVEVDGISG